MSDIYLINQEVEMLRSQVVSQGILVENTIVIGLELPNRDGLYFFSENLQGFLDDHEPSEIAEIIGSDPQDVEAAIEDDGFIQHCILNNKSGMIVEIGIPEHEFLFNRGESEPCGSEVNEGVYIIKYIYADDILDAMKKIVDKGNQVYAEMMSKAIKKRSGND